MSDRPNEELMRLYGTEDVFLMKEASPTPFAAKMLFAMAAMGMAHHFAEDFQAQRAQAMEMNEMFQQLAAARGAGMQENMRYTRPPLLIAPSLPMGGPRDSNMMEGIPLGFDQGMVRTAAIARETGRGMAKMAIGLPWGDMATGAKNIAKRVGGTVAGGVKGLGRNAATIGALGIGAAGLGAYAAGKKGLGYLSQEAPQRSYGGVQMGAPQLAYGINEYGQPQVGAPFIQ